jgi:hypothetical protein
MTASGDVYTHVLIDGEEVDYLSLLGSSARVP